MKRTRRRQDDGALPLHVIDTLLDDPRPRDEIEALHAAGAEYDEFWQFDVSLAELDALWELHRADLVAEAERRQVPVPDRYREPQPGGPDAAA